MSLLAFQRAIADMAASPALCRRVLDDAHGTLAGYDLTPLEVQRLASAADQRGMRMNCMLYRNGRLSPLVSQLPGTFHVLGYQLREVAEAFWVENPKVPRGVPGEMRRFAAFLRRRIAEGALTEPLLPEVLDWEMETYELALLPPERTKADVAEAAARARTRRCARIRWWASPASPASPSRSCARWRRSARSRTTTRSPASTTCWWTSAGCSAGWRRWMRESPPPSAPFAPATRFRPRPPRRSSRRGWP